MDISKINVNQINQSIGIKVGSDTAPIKVIEFINLHCPYCRQWFEESKETFDDYVAAGKVQRVIKLFDKEKPELAKGNTMHQYVAKSQEALPSIASIYDTQESWGALETSAEIAFFAEKELNLTLDADQKTSDAIVLEADTAGIVFVPTIIINNHIFDQKISQVDFKTILDSTLD